MSTFEAGDRAMFADGYGIHKILTEGEVYDVVDVDRAIIRIRDDRGKLKWFASRRFKKVHDGLKPRPFRLTMTARLNVAHGEQVTSWPDLLDGLYPVVNAIIGASLPGVTFAGWDADVQVEPAPMKERPLEVGDRVTTPSSPDPAEVAHIVPFGNDEVRYVLKRGETYVERLWPASSLTPVVE